LPAAAADAAVVLAAAVAAQGVPKVPGLEVLDVPRPAVVVRLAGRRCRSI
jgi:hypothetical protein